MLIYKKINEYLENKEKEKYFSLIDYTKISDSLTNDNIKEFCKDAINNNFHSICVLSKYIVPVNSFIKNEVKICSLVDFPKGESKTINKIKEIEESIVNGANEIDVVINYSLIKDQENVEILEQEIRELTEYCHKEGSTIKAIIEIGALNYQEIEQLCKICSENNVDFVMTSTGKLNNDDTFEKKLEKVKFMRKILPSEIGIKFSGGIRTIEQIKEISPFVDRIGTSILIN
jgi:deoxyribose-phosphate aldolase